jgi:hypothetical protein
MRVQSVHRYQGHISAQAGGRLLKKVAWIIICVAALGMGTRAGAEQWALGVGYPYLSLKYDFMPEISAEAKWAGGDGISVYAGRGYWNFIHTQSLKAFTGVEAGGLVFNTLGLFGTGLEYGVFVGGSYRLFASLDLTLDIGPSIIQMEAREQTAAGIEWIITTGLLWYVY